MLGSNRDSILAAVRQNQNEIERRKMKNAKFTPGNWKVLTRVGNDKSFCVRVGLDEEHTVTWLDFWTDTHCTSQKSQDEQLANARLIAAAPELLEALKTCLAHAERLLEVSDSIDGVIDSIGGRLGVMEDIEQAKAALDKATP